MITITIVKLYVMFNDITYVFSTLLSSTEMQPQQKPRIHGDVFAQREWKVSQFNQLE